MSERLETIKSALGNKFEVKNLITRGGMAELYRGVHIALNKQVAIKIIRNEMAGVTGFKERFLREAQLAANLDHPVIINIYDFGSKDEFDYLIMPFIEGLTLEESINQTKIIGLQECLRLAIILTDALCYAHDANVIHRDIKPSNVMIDKAGHIFLTDFGISKDLGDVGLTAPNSVFGTPKYISPEQIRGIQADKRSDLYSLGLVFYEIVTGKHPFEHQDMNSLYYSHVHEIPVRPEESRSDIPPKLGEIIMKLLEKSPDRRYQDARTLLKDLESVHLKSGVAPQHQAKPPVAKADMVWDKTRLLEPAQNVKPTDAKAEIVWDTTKLLQPATKTEAGGEGAKGPVAKSTTYKGLLMLSGMVVAVVATIGILWFTTFSEREQGVLKSAAPTVSVESDQPPPPKVVKTTNAPPQAKGHSNTTASIERDRPIPSTVVETTNDRPQAKGHSNTTASIERDRPIPSTVVETTNDKPKAEGLSKTTASFDSIVNGILALGKAREADFFQVYLDKPQFVVGDRISYHFESAERCYLVLLTVTTSGELVQIFPNRYNVNQFVKANTKYTVPGNQSGIVLEVSGPPGREQLVALTAKEPFDLLPVNFESQPFFQVDRNNQGVLEEIAQNLQTAERRPVAQNRVTYWIADDAG